MAVKVRQSKAPLPTSNGQAPLRPVAYCRVSSLGQKEKQTIKTQLDQITRYCEREGLTLVDIYIDEAQSGMKRFQDRPGAQRLLRDAQAGKFNLVLVTDFDRLGREGEVNFVAKNLLSALGIGLYGISENIAVAAPGGELIFSIKTTLGSEVRRQMLEKMAAGLMRVAREGKWPCGRPPYGYQIEGRCLTPHPQEAETVKLIFRLAVARTSTMQIAAHLNAAGLRPRVGARWRFSCVARLLHHPAYRGVYEWQGRGERVSLQVPRLVSDEVWHRAQEALQLNAHASTRNAKRDYLLKSLLVCVLCGRHMTGCIVSNGNTRYYRCTGRHADVLVKCTSRYVNADRLESLVYNQIRDWLSRQDDLEQLMREAYRTHDQQQAVWVETLARLKAQLAQKTHGYQKLLRALRNDLITEDDFTAQVEEMKTERAQLEQSITALEREGVGLDIDQVVHSVREQLAHFRRNVQRGTLSFQQKRDIIQDMVQEIRVRLPKGSQITGHICEVLPFRPHIENLSAREQRKILWQRDGYQAEDSEPWVEIHYTLPLPKAHAIGVIDSLPEEKVLRRENRRVHTWPQLQNFARRH